MTTPQVVEKQLIDINLAGGIDESQPEEQVDWTKNLTEATNVLVDGKGLRLRPGLKYAASNHDYTSFTRIGDMDAGLIGINSARLFKYNEAITQAISDTKNMEPSGPAQNSYLPGYDVQTSVIGSSDVSIIAGLAVFTDYHVVACRSPGTSTAGMIVIKDPESGGVLRHWYTTKNIMAIVAVDDDYLHIYCGDGSMAPTIGVVDMQDFDLLPDDQALLDNESLITGVGFDTLSGYVPGIAAGATLAGVGSMTGFSVFVTRGTTAYVGRIAGNTGTWHGDDIAGVFTTATDMDCSSAGAIMIAGYLTGAPDRYKVLFGSVTNTTWTTSRTVTDTTATSVGTELRIVRHPLTGAAGLVGYCALTVNSETYPATQLYTLSSGGTSFALLGYLPMWCEVSRPFYADGYRVIVANQMRNGTGSGTYDPIANSVCVINFGSGVVISDTTYPRRFNAMAVLDNYTATLDPNSNASDGSAKRTTAFHVPIRPYVSSDSSFISAFSESVVIPHLNSSGSTVGQYRLVLAKCTKTDQQMSIGGDIVSGGGVWAYDGYQAAEAGFLCAPTITVDETGVGGSGPAAGVYSYVAVIEYTDDLGRLHRSRVSRPYTVTMTGLKVVDIYVLVPTVTSKSAPMYTCIYRTTVGGSQYYLLAKFQTATAAPTTVTAECVDTFNDSNYTDAVIAANPLLHRQPGTQGTALDRYHGLANAHCIRHKDRVFYCRNNTVYYSSFNVEGEAPWFNPAFSFQVPGGTGNITALASMDGMLVVFKKDSVFLVDGDGPPENGGNGSEFAPPRRLNTQFGCINQRTLVVAQDGLMYRSVRGIEMMTRALKFVFVGQRIQRTVDANVYDHGSTFDRKSGRALWNIGPDAWVDGNYPGDRTVICYDTVADAWTTHKYQIPSDASTLAASGPRDICYSDAGSGGVYFSMTYRSNDDSSMVMREDWDVGYDQYGAYVSDADDLEERHVPVTITTGWVCAPSKQDRIRVTDLLLLGFRHSNHNLKCTYAKDYSRSSYTTIKTFTASETTLTPEQVEFQPSVEAVQSMKFKLTTETPTVSTAIGTGRQLDINALTVRVGIRGGGAKLASTQKG